MTFSFERACNSKQNLLYKKPFCNLTLLAFLNKKGKKRAFSITQKAACSLS